MSRGPVPPYGVAIQEALASGKLSRMKEVAAEAETYVRQTGDLSAALEKLKSEINRLETRTRGR